MKKIDFYFKRITTNTKAANSSDFLNSKPLIETCLKKNSPNIQSFTKSSYNFASKNISDTDSQKPTLKKARLELTKESVIAEPIFHKNRQKMSEEKNSRIILERSKKHSFLIDVQVFNKENKIKVHPERFIPSDVDDDSFLVPYCFSTQSVKPFDESSQDAFNDQTYNSKNKQNKTRNKKINSYNKDKNEKINIGEEHGVQQPDGINTSKREVVKDGIKSVYELDYRDNVDSKSCNNNTKETLTQEEQNNADAYVSFKDLVRASIQSLLNIQNITASHLTNTIQSYHRNKLNFQCLTQTFDLLSQEEREDFFKVTLPCILALVLETASIITQPIPILRRNMAACITMSQLQAACLLSNMFMGTFHPHKPLFNNNSFERLFGVTAGGRGRSQIGKLMCFFNYFRRVAKERDCYGERGLITIERKCVPETRHSCWWEESGVTVGGVEVCREGCIEDADGHLQVDFANKFIGGGVLRTGAVQEEIRFSLCPEAVVSCLLAEKMGDNECVVLRGCERFNTHKGYANTFTFHQDYQDPTSRDAWRRIETSIVAMDARSYNQSCTQFKMENILRELNKAYCGFSTCDFECHFPILPVATGNWGCGAFKGDLQLKSMIQLLAASMAGRKMRYYIFGESAFGAKLEQVVLQLTRTHTSVGALYRILNSYNNNTSVDLFTHINNKL